ncbi:MAG: exodeoxyribonuclease VII large subunit [Candidatus Omnitrophota bacterium]
MPRNHPDNSAELFALPEKRPSPRHIYSVSEVTHDIKGILENTFREIWVEGEISNFKPSSSGHYFFSLKDENALLNAVIFSRNIQEIKFKPEDGIKVVCCGNIGVYPPHGGYRLIVEKIAPQGLGNLQLALEQLKKKLEKEGLFSPAHKRLIPYLPQRIGIVTSLQGAALHDILKVLERRFSDVEVIIYPVKVQGDGAKEEIAEAINNLNQFSKQEAPSAGIDVLIVGRGGGSIEDLWAFNEEVVARAIYNSKIPVISAVGHEKDWTIADLTADLRAATPSVAAELAVPEKNDLLGKIEKLLDNMSLAIDHILEDKEEDLAKSIDNLRLLNPLVRLKVYQERISGFVSQIITRARHLLELKQAALQEAVSRLGALSPLNILGRGYSITFKLPEGVVLKDARLLKAGDELKTRLGKGEIFSKVTEVK